ncbi:hypothetical protein [Microcoleus sp. B3-D7]|uniref:hypothetical protein n=1 Tax=Microcoleus sp. B3-D7 TaxID=2818659 RepID=UPI002FD0F6A5
MKTLFKIGDEVSWDSSVGTVSGIVEQVVLDGLIPKISIDIATTKTTPGYLIKLANRQDDVFVGKLHSDLREPKTEVAVTEVAPDRHDTLPYLTKPQLAKLNKFRPSGFPLIADETMVAISFVVADNLINRSKGKWTEKDLAKMAKMLDRMGLPHILNHNWESVEDVQGIIIEAKLVKSKPPSELVDALQNGELNRQIVKNEEFVQVVATVAFPANSGIVDKLKIGLGRAVSLGGFSFKDYVCPLCNTSFSFKNCPHYIPDSWTEWDADPSLVAPYYIRDGLYDLGELSTVVIANLPGASLVTAGNGV